MYKREVEQTLCENEIMINFVQQFITNIDNMEDNKQQG